MELQKIDGEIETKNLKNSILHQLFFFEKLVAKLSY